MKKNKTNPAHMKCPWCNKKRVAFFSALGSEADGFTVAIKYTACEDCRPKLTSECPSTARVKILRLDLSIIDRQFKNAIDRKQMEEFIKRALGI